MSKEFLRTARIDSIIIQTKRNRKSFPFFPVILFLIIIDRKGYTIMKEIILCKYGEISLKGANRSYFEKLLRDILKRRTSPYGNFKIYSMQSTVYIEPLDEYADIDSAYRIAKNTFGISAINRAIETEKNMDAILNTVKTQFMP